MRVAALIFGLFCCALTCASLGSAAPNVAQSVALSHFNASGPVTTTWGTADSPYSDTPAPTVTPTPTPAPTPTPTPQRTPLDVYLDTPAAAPSPCSTPSGILCYSNATPTVFVMVLAQDPATGVAMEVELQNRFMRAQAHDAAGWRNHGVSFSVAPFGWGLSDFVNACNAAPLHTDKDGKHGIAGALIVFAASMQANAYNYLLMTRGETRIDADAQFVQCEANSGVANGANARPVGTIFDDVIGAGNRNSFSFGTAAAVASAISALSNARTDTYTYPSPGVSGTPSVTSYTIMHGYNSQNATGALAAAAVTGLASGSQLTFPGNNAPAQLKIAAQRFADELYRRACWDGDGNWQSLMLLLGNAPTGSPPSCPPPKP
jgi:hypothetical protein